jgi:5-amino-6-(5-phosphoribosylamino)uracil reductase
MGVERLLLEGGRALNGAFLRAGSIDEIGLMIASAIDGRLGAPSAFVGSRRRAPPLHALTLQEYRILANSGIWLRYAIGHSS